MAGALQWLLHTKEEMALWMKHLVRLVLLCQDTENTRKTHT